MATFRATFFTVTETTRALTGATMPLPVLPGTRLTDLTTSGTSGAVQASGSDWTAPSDGVVQVVCDGAVNIASGTSPTAAATAGFYLPASTVMHFAIPAGHKLAVIDA